MTSRPVGQEGHCFLVANVAPLRSMIVASQYCIPVLHNRNYEKRWPLAGVHGCWCW